MSGPMQPAVAQAAGSHALIAQAHAEGVHPGVVIARNLRASLDARTPTERDSLPGRAWRAIPIKVRLALVMLASTQRGDPSVIALQPWESFTDSDRAEIGACAREFRRGLSDAASLW